MKTTNRDKIKKKLKMMEESVKKKDNKKTLKLSREIRNAMLKEESK